MAVKLELYRVFQEVARMGNISAAAQNLFISQSAVSQSIKQLEEQLQVRLFSRSTRGVVLTSEGKILLDYVSHGLGLIQCGEEKLAQSRQLLTGELIIGASDTVTKTYLVSRLEAFHQNYPAIQIRILNGTSQMVLDYLHAGQVDIAFASEPKDKDAYSVRHCFDTHQLFVAAPHDVVAHRDHHGRAVGHGCQRAGLRCGQVADGLKRGGAFTGRSGVLGRRLSPGDAHGPLARAFHNLYGATAGRRQALEILDRDHLVGKHLELLVRLALSGKLVQGLGGQDHGLRTGFVPCIDLHDDSPFAAALRRSQTCYGVGMGAPAPTSCQCTHRNIRSCIKRTR